MNPVSPPTMARAHLTNLNPKKHKKIPMKIITIEKIQGFSSKNNRIPL